MVIRLMSAIGWTTTMARDFTAYRRDRSIKASSDLTSRRTGSDPSRYILSLSKGEGQTRAPTGCWSNPSARQQQTANGSMWLAIAAPDLMQRPAFQRRQISVLWVNESLACFPSLINTIPKQKVY